MRLIRFLVSAFVLLGGIYFSLAVPIGHKTLWQHIRSIAASKESRELVESVKEEAAKVIQKDSGLNAHKTHEQTSADRLTAEERRVLRKLIQKKLDDQKQTDTALEPAPNAASPE